MLGERELDSRDMAVSRLASPLVVEALEDESAFHGLEPEWDALLSASGAYNLFLSWDWVSTWWAVYGSSSQLFVLTARDQSGRLIGIAPLKRRVIGPAGLRLMQVTEFIGYGGDVTPERLDFIVQPGCAREVVAAFMPHVGGRALDLRPFDAASTCLPYLEHELRGQGGRVDRVSDAISPILTLPDTFDAFIASRSKNYRKKIGEYTRRCERDLKARVRISQHEDELMQDMETLVSLHRARWRGRSRAFQSSLYRDFHRRLARRLLESGRVRMFALDTTKGAVAMLYCLTDGARYYYYQAGRDPACSQYRVGLVLMHRAIEHAISEHVRVFDFLRGQEEYKYMWAEGEVASVRLTYWKSWPAWAFAQVLSFAHLAQVNIESGLLALGALASVAGDS
jgi:CelD/BcsL family acetyltransferase involved in cellulose biosynthesis